MLIFDCRNLAALLLLIVATPATAVGLPLCSEAEAQVPKVLLPEALDHRLFEPPVVNYPAGTDPERVSEYIAVSIRVDASGRPACLIELDIDSSSSRLRQKLLAAVLDWRFRPFVRDGLPAPVQVYLEIDSQVLPGRTVAVPPVRAEDTTVSLARAGCFWQCAEYAVTVRGDGWVGYQGIQHVDVEGTRAWRIPAADVATLLALARDPGLWAADDVYRRDMHDAETIIVRVDAGGQRKQVLLYPAQNTAAPIALRRLAEAIEQRTGVRRWARLSNETIDSLQREGFDFASPAGRDLLVRSIRYQGRIDEAAVLRLLALGASAETAANPSGWTVLQAALYERNFGLVTPLIEHGVLLTDGRPDQAKIDSAFEAAIRAGRLAPAQQIWQIAGTRPHPALDFADVGRGEVPSRRRSPVVLLLVESGYIDDAWEGEQIARWLESLGNDLTATSEDNRTLMHAVRHTDDPGFMHFLLSRKLDPSVLGQRDLMAYSVRHGEDMALTLLDAQLVRRPDGWELPSDYRYVAELQDWPRVIAWLDAHPEVTHREPSTPCPRVAQTPAPTGTKKPATGTCGAARPAGN